MSIAPSTAREVGPPREHSGRGPGVYAGPGAVPGAQAQETISKVKIGPQRFAATRSCCGRGRGSRRALRPRVRAGAPPGDGSDLLSPCADRPVPSSGGPFKVTARLSPELLSEGSLLLDEVDRDGPVARWSRSPRSSPCSALAGPSPRSPCIPGRGATSGRCISVRRCG